MSTACSLSDISGWRAGVLYPLAGGGRESGAAHLDLLGPPGRCSGCWPHDGDVAGGAGFLFSDIPVRGRRWRSGDRSDRRCGRRGATGSTAPTALIESRVEGVYGVLSLRHFRLARWCSLSLGGWWPRIRRGAVADQPPLLKPFYKESRFQRTSTRQQLDCAKTQLLCSQENRRIPTFDGLSTCS